MSGYDEETPRGQGYHWPAEWEPHRATWLSWPHNHETWPGQFPAVVERFVELVRTLTEFEPVNILAGNPAVMAEARRRLRGLRNVQLFDIPTNDAWCRDHGPMFLVGPRDKPPALVDWDYNAWGGKYPPFADDNNVPRRIAKELGYRRFVPGLVLEGGALDGNGLGTVLASKTCLLHPNRNSGHGQSDIEQLLAAHLSTTNVLWLAGGELAGDDTDGHVDQLARFVNAETLVVATEPDPSDANHDPLKQNLAQLRSLAAGGGGFEVIPLPLPAPKLAGSQRLPASYCNFYIANGLVLVPQFADPADDIALGILRELLPDREVVGFGAAELIWGLGAIHCLTQQEPMGISNEE